MDRVHRQAEAIDVEDHCLAGSVAGPAVHVGRRFMADAYDVLGRTVDTGWCHPEMASGLPSVVLTGARTAGW